MKKTLLSMFAVVVLAFGSYGVYQHQQAQVVLSHHHQTVINDEEVSYPQHQVIVDDKEVVYPKIHQIVINDEEVK